MSRQSELAALGRVADTSALSNRNLIINGAMQVAQRGTSVTGIGNGDTGCQTVDRFRFMEGSSPTYLLNVLQSTDAPEGFSNSFKFVVTTAQSSLGSTDQMGMDYSIEGQDLQHLKWGTSSAQNLTLSFWAKSNKTGTYVVWFYKWDDQRAITTTYTIDAADTWEYKTITIVGDTTGALDNNNGKSLLIRWVMAGGTGTTSGTASDTWRADVTTNRNVGLSVNLADTVNNEFLLTGVQLEVGDTATPFEHRSYGDELARCQRYYQRFEGSNAGIMNHHNRTTTARYGVLHHPVKFRTTPTLGYSSLSHFISYVAGTSATPTAIARQGETGISTEILINTAANGSAGQAGWLRVGTASGAYLDFDAEL